MLLLLLRCHLRLPSHGRMILIVLAVLAVLLVVWVVLVLYVRVLSMVVGGAVRADLTTMMMLLMQWLSLISRSILRIAPIPSAVGIVCGDMTSLSSSPAISVSTIRP